MDSEASAQAKTEELKEVLTSFLQDCARQHPNCISRLGKAKVLSCSCLRCMDNSDVAKAVAKFCIYFGLLKRVQQQEKVSDWIRYSENKSTYRLPFVADRSTGNEALALLQNQKMCVSSIMVILGFGRKFWNAAKKIACFGGVQSEEHALKGRLPNSFTDDNARAAADVKDFLNVLGETYGEPRATRVVRTIIGIELRDEEKGLLELPPSMSRRGLYRRFIRDRGYDMSVSPNGTVTIFERIDDEWVKDPDNE